mgnify:CR=1 FL=1
MPISPTLSQAANAYINASRMKGGMNAPGTGEGPDGINPEFSQLISEAQEKARGAEDAANRRRLARPYHLGVPGHYQDADLRGDWMIGNW